MKIAIYQIINLKNNFRYIGSTNNFSSRKTQHIKLLKNNMHHCLLLQKDFNKYGIDNFEFTIIEQISNNYRYISEEWYIQKYINKIYNTVLIPVDYIKFDIQELKSILKILIEDKTKSIKKVLKNYIMTESIFHHTVTLQDRNQTLLDSETKNLIKKYKNIERKNPGNRKYQEEIYFKSPTGEKIKLDTLTNFSKKYKLSVGGLSELKRGKRKSLKGWTLYG